MMVNLNHYSWLHTLSTSSYSITDGSGYVEDGREVFDDDLDDEHVGNSKGTKTRGRKKDSSKSGGPVKTSNIKNMFLNIPSKNKEVSHLFAQFGYQYSLKGIN